MFRNPFLRTGEKRSILFGDPLAEPDITMPMAADFLRACDDWELAVFAPMVLFGLRAAEPCFLFAGFLQPGWLLVPNIPDLDYKTKGRRDKRFPLLPELNGYWDSLRAARLSGLLFRTRDIHEVECTAVLKDRSLEELQAAYRDRQHGRTLDHRERKIARNRLFRDAGAVTYDELEDAFQSLRLRLGWPVAATMKDFRHLFATTLANAGMPEAYRKYLLGHGQGRDAAVAYTHLNQLRNHYERIVRSEYSDIIGILQSRFLSTPSLQHQDAVAVVPRERKTP